MSKKMLVNATHPEENRVAIVVDGILTELDVEVSGREPTKGNIYKAVVVRVESGLQAAFVDYGAERLGFLQIDEVNAATVKPDYKTGENGKNRPRITDLLHRGQEILVQITKEERGTKGAALTTYLSLAGRFMVCMPGSQTRGVSRKVESDAERKQLKKAMSTLDLPDDIGYIVRTAGLGKSQEELQRDFNFLMRLYDGIRELGKSARAPSLIYKESNLVIRSIRDYFTTEMDEVLIDDPDVFKEAREFFQRVMPEHAGLVKLHQERRPIFSRYQIEEQIDTINQNKVQLPSGGSIVIDATEALVAIDVNSGKMTSEQGVEATAFKSNVEAAVEIGRQLRLRDLGGLIVIDFIDMRDRKHIRDVENTLKKSLENDKARVSIGRISSKFGLLELSRQRIKSALTEGTLLTCPHCQGSGRIKSPESLAVGLMRRIHAGVAKGQIGKVDAQLPLDVASYLLNNKREELYEMERRHNLRIHIHGRPDFLTDHIDIDFQKREKEKQILAEYVEAGNLPPQEEPELEERKDAVEPAEAEAADKTKKRRRRRRRKPATDKGDSEAPQNPAEDLAGEAVADAPRPVQDGEEYAQTPAAAAESAVETLEGTPAEPEKRPKRRRSPRKKATPKPGVATEEPAASASHTSAPGDMEAASKEEGAVAFLADEPAAETDQSPAAKPKRRRPLRKKTAQITAGANDGSESTVDRPEPPETTSPPQVAMDTAAENEPKPNRRRAPRRKAAVATLSVPPEADTERSPTADAANQTGKSDVPEGNAETKPKPRRPARKRSPAKNDTRAEGPAAVRQTAPESAGVEKTDQPSSAVINSETKPKRRRSPRKKATETPEPAE